jgi:hypothetical protein
LWGGLPRSARTENAAPRNGALRFPLNRTVTTASNCAAALHQRGRRPTCLLRLFFPWKATEPNDARTLGANEPILPCDCFWGKTGPERKPKVANCQSQAACRRPIQDETLRSTSDVLS